MTGTGNYKDADGNPISPLNLVKKEPEWAANIIPWLKNKLTAAEQRAAQAEREAVRECEKMVCSFATNQVGVGADAWNEALAECKRMKEAR